MAKYIIGTTGGGREPATQVESMVRIEKQGFSAAWMTSGSGMDPVSLSAIGATKTERVKLGTAIQHIWSMPPVKMAQIGQIAAQLSGGRFRLGLGLGSKAAAEDMWGQAYSAQFGHLREYIEIIRTLVANGSIDFHGKHYRAKASIANPAPMPVMIAALGPGAFEIAGEISDGAISWVSPNTYIRDVAQPAIRRGAERAGRPVPPIIAHAPVVVHENIEEVREAARKQFGFYVRAPHYQQMFIAAGFAEARDAIWSDAMLDAVVISGNEEQVTQRVADLAEWSGGEVLASPIAGLATERTIALLGSLAQQ